MSDFLDALEHELTRAARRRAAPPASARQGALRDLRAVGRGALVTSTVAIVALVVATVALVGRHRVAALDRPAPASASPSRSASASAGLRGTMTQCPGRTVGSVPGRALASWLSGTPPTDQTARDAALRLLDRSAAQAAVIDVRSIRAVTVPGLGLVAVVAALSCGSSRTIVLAEVPSRDGTATIDLGSISDIRSGAAFRSRSLMIRTTSGLRTVSAVPVGVVRVVCVHAGTRRRFTVSGHLVLLPSGAGDCNLVYGAAAGGRAASA